MKTVYICGDSFSATDPEYGVSWTERLATLLTGTATVINLSSVAASNLLINIQVDYAIRNSADFIIVQGTAVTRSEVAVADVADRELIERFQQNELIAYSILRPYRSQLTTAQQQQVEQYHQAFFDLDLAIYRDCVIIQNTLSRLQQSGIPFLFDQGGFEHPKFGGTQRYFEQYDPNRSDINLWDWGNTEDERPYYHIKDPAVHAEISDYYARKIVSALEIK